MLCCTYVLKWSVLKLWIYYYVIDVGWHVERSLHENI